MDYLEGLTHFLEDVLLLYIIAYYKWSLSNKTLTASKKKFTFYFFKFFLIHNKLHKDP